MCFGVRIFHCKPYLFVWILITTIFKELTWWSPIFEVGEVLTLSSASSEKRLCWGACSPANWRCVARDPEGPQDRTSHCKAASSLEARLVRLVTCLTTDPTNFTAPKMMKQRIQGIFHQGEPGGFHFRKGRIRYYLHGFAMFRKIYRWQAAGTAGTARNRYVCIISHLSQNQSNMVCKPQIPQIPWSVWWIIPHLNTTWDNCPHSKLWQDAFTKEEHFQRLNRPWLRWMLKQFPMASLHLCWSFLWKENMSCCHESTPIQIRQCIINIFKNNQLHQEASLEPIVGCQISCRWREAVVAPHISDKCDWACDPRAASVPS